jgi:hypothetical protein
MPRGPIHTPNELRWSRQARVAIPKRVLDCPHEAFTRHRQLDDDAITDERVRSHGVNQALGPTAQAAPQHRLGLRPRGESSQ